MNSLSIALHIGAPQTDNGQLVWSLRKDGLELMKEGVLVRRPGLYQKSVKALRQSQAQDFVSDDQKEALLSGIVKTQDAWRVVLSDPEYLGMPAWMLQGGRLFNNAGRNTSALRALFPGHSCEFFLGISNPATVIPAVFKSQLNRPLAQFLSDVDLQSLRWSDVITDILEANPENPLTVWTNEETPMIWPTILQRVTDLPETFGFSGVSDILERIMSDEGLKRMEAHFAEHPEYHEPQREKVRALFLEKFYSEQEVEEEIDLPGWSQELIDEMTQIYLDDIEVIKKIPDLNFISASL